MCLLPIVVACASEVVGTLQDATGTDTTRPDTVWTRPDDSETLAPEEPGTTQTEGCESSDFAELPVWEPDGPLCALPDDYVHSGGDPVDIPCDIAYGGSTSQDPEIVPEALVVVTWNLHFGADHQDLLDELADNDVLQSADLIVLQEVARNDTSSNPVGVDQARELAQQLDMVYASAVEWDWRETGGGEHVITVLSKYPLGDATMIRHTPLHDYWSEGRYGGRATLGVDVRLGCDLLRLYSVHLDTEDFTGEGRALQGSEVRADADLPGRPERQIVAGDFNTWLCNPLQADCATAPDAELVVEEFLDDGWSDSTAGFGSYTQLGVGFFPQRLDWMFHRGSVAGVSWAVLQDANGSDHFPVVGTFTVMP